MKISSGFLRGMKIIMPKNKITRPTLSRVREAVFNILAPDLQGSIFWDLFSGSGALGLTAISEGARDCVFLEEDRTALLALKTNIEEAKKRAVSDGQPPIKAYLIPASLAKSWNRLLSLEPPDIIWADPPYEDSVKWALLLRQQLMSFVKSGGLFLMEMKSDDLAKAGEEFLLDPAWETLKTRKYGGSSIVVWRKL